MFCSHSLSFLYLTWVKKLFLSLLLFPPPYPFPFIFPCVDCSSSQQGLHEKHQDMLLGSISILLAVPPSPLRGSSWMGSFLT